MRISAKGRYGIAVMVTLAQHMDQEEYTPVINISEELDISKIYLEQVFSLLKRAELVLSTKGAQGGYRLVREPENINIYDILSAIETALFEHTKETVEKSAPDLEASMNSIIFNSLDHSVREHLKKISLKNILEDVDERRGNDSFMFYI